MSKPRTLERGTAAHLVFKRVIEHEHGARGPRASIAANLQMWIEHGVGLQARRSASNTHGHGADGVTSHMWGGIGPRNTC